MTALEDRPAEQDPHPAPRTSLPGWVVPVAVGGAALVVSFLLAPDVVVGTLTTPRALVLLLVIVVGFVLLSRLLGRFVASPLLRLAGMAVPVALLLWLVVLPSVQDEVVDEALPGLETAAAPAEAADEEAVDESVADEGGDGDVAAGGQTVEVDPPVVPAGPVELGRGPLEPLDYDAVGEVLLVELADGSTVVRLQDIDVAPGPDYDVFLVPGADAEAPGDAGVKLDDLRGNVGSSNYDVPADLAVDRPVTVLIWCTAFGLPVAHATVA